MDLHKAIELKDIEYIKTYIEGNKNVDTKKKKNCIIEHFPKDMLLEICKYM